MHFSTALKYYESNEQITFISRRKFWAVVRMHDNKYGLIKINIWNYSFQIMHRTNACTTVHVWVGWPLSCTFIILILCIQLKNACMCTRMIWTLKCAVQVYIDLNCIFNLVQVYIVN